MGYSPLSGQLRGRALGPFKVDARAKNPENAVSYEFKYIGSSLELARSLNISAQASFSGISGGASASLNLFRSSSISSTNVYILVRMSVISEVRTIENYNLNPTALKRLNKRGQAAFATAYGDAFLYSITYGGELYALLEFEASSRAEKEKLDVQVSGSMGGFSAKASLSENMSKLLQEKKVRISYAQSGGGSGEPVVPKTGADGKLEPSTTGGVLVIDPDELIERIRRFPHEVRAQAANSKPIFGETLDYNTIHNLPEGHSFAPNFRPQWALEDLARLRILLDAERATAERIAFSGTRYLPADVQTARTRLDYLDQALIEIDRVGMTIIATPSIVPKLATSAKFQPLVSVSNSKPCQIVEAEARVAKKCLLGPADFLPEAIPLSGPATVTQHRLWRGNPPAESVGNVDGGIFRESWFGQFVGCSSPADLQARADALCDKPNNPKVRVELLGTEARSGRGSCKVFESYTVVCIK
ncbi:hypothetical protein [Agrobacterium pusense]|uniref:hypothetical protein n=1 Tax=Agrobacterium pusense TaxID=648995 RepID=UPI0032DB2A36